MSDETMANSLNIELEVEPEANTEIETFVPEPKNDDYQYARETVRKAVDVGQIALSDLLTLARRTEHPRMYEAITNLIKTIAEADRHLIEIQKLDAETTQIRTGGIKNITQIQGPENVHNNLFLGSTYDLQKLLQRATNSLPEESDEEEVKTVDGTVNTAS